MALHIASVCLVCAQEYRCLGSDADGEGSMKLMGSVEWQYAQPKRVPDVWLRVARIEDNGQVITALAANVHGQRDSTMQSWPLFSPLSVVIILCSTFMHYTCSRK